jgi:hypothetical protein
MEISIPSEIVATVSARPFPGLPFTTVQVKLRVAVFCPEIAPQLLAPTPSATAALNAAIVAAVAATGLCTVTVTDDSPVPQALLPPFPFVQVSVYVGTVTLPALTRVNVPLMTDTFPVLAATRKVPVPVGLDCTTLPIFGSAAWPAESEMVAAVAQCA